MVEKIHGYIVDHDNRWSFILAYVGLAVVLALLLSLFWLIVVVAVHGLFEWIKLRQEYDDWRAIATRVAWELKLDVGLIFFGLGLGIYMDTVLGMLGLGHAARAGVQAGGKVAGRFAVWQNVLRGALLSVDDAAQVVRMVAAKGSTGADGDLEGGDEEAWGAAQTGRVKDANWIWGPWKEPYGKGDKFAIGFGIFCAVMIVVSPWLTPHDWASVWAELSSELVPFPGGD